MLDDLAGRWRTSIHESAHAVVAIVLGGKCDHLTLYPDDSGLASLDQLSPFDLAVSQAAASAAETLLADEIPPGPEPKPRTIAGREACDVSPSVDLAVLASRIPRGEAVSDERAVALFCIAGLEHEPPERWVNRFYTIHAVAQRVVSDHRDSILRVASLLYAKGVLSEGDILMELERA